MSQETNPFRLSMLRRSQSPIEDPFEQSTVLERPSIRHPSSGSTGSSRSGSETSASHGHNNPFRVNLSDPSPDANAAATSSSSTAFNKSYVPSPGATGLAVPEPPSYFESEGRRHSDPNLTRGDEKPPLRDDSYREGYEEGMRMARERERQRRRELRERRARLGNGGEPGSSGSHRSSEHREHRSSEHRSSDREHRSSGAHRSSGDRTRRSRSKSESAGNHRSRSKQQQSASLDVIDKMDITGLYGGSSFHHDGPFDACAPHRNKTTKRNPATPISAFPADGPNNSLAVEDPRLLAYRKEETVYGRNINNDPPPEITQASFDPTERGSKVHGQQTLGLGSSTFIDGTPASRDAIEQAGRERSQSLGRSRSLMRRRAPEDSNFGGNDEPKSLLSRVRSLRVSRH